MYDAAESAKVLDRTVGCCYLDIIMESYLKDPVYISSC
jgi:hypothetical protein